MKTKWKVLLGVVVLALAAGGVVAGMKYNQRGIVTVQTGKVVRQDLASVVTASGEIKPKLTSILAQIQSAPRASHKFLIAEGSRVKKGQIVARLESVQAEADVAAQRAGVSTTQAESAASEAGLKAADEAVTTAQATLERSKADLERARIDFERTSETRFREADCAAGVRCQADRVVFGAGCRLMRHRHGLTRLAHNVHRPPRL